VRFTPQDEEFRAEVRAWLDANLTGPFAGLRGAGGPGREHDRYAAATPVSEFVRPGPPVTRASAAMIEIGRADGL